MFVLTQVYRPDHLFLQERLDPGAPERLSEGRDVTHRWTRQNALPCPGCGRGDSVSGCAIKQKPLKTLFHQFRVALSVPAWLSAIWLTTLFAAPVCAQEISNEQRNYFEKHVRPLLAEQCLNCHSADSDEPGGNLRLDSQPGWSEGGD